MADNTICKPRIRDLIELLPAKEEIAKQIVKRFPGFIEEPLSPGGETILHFQVIEDNVNIVRSLIRLGANVNATKSDGTTPLIDAVFLSHIEIIRMLLDNGANIDAKRKDGRTALHIAADRESCAKAIRILLQRGANFKLRTTTTGETPLGIACFGNVISSVRELIEFEPNLDSSADSSGLSPLMLASENGHIEIINLLLDKGANINHGDQNGDTALHHAAYNNMKKSVDVLLSRGASKKIKNIEGKTYHDLLREPPSN